MDQHTFLRTGILLLALLGTIGLATTGLLHAQDDVKTPDATVYVDGLACPFCAYGLEKKLKNLDAIRALEVQLEEGRVLLTFKEGQSLTKEEIQQAVEKAGFTARKIELSGEPASARTSP